MRLPIRARLAVVTALMMAAVLLPLGGFVYLRFGADLLEAVEAGLRSRADALTIDLDPLGAPSTPDDPAGGAVRIDDPFAQILGRDGSIIESSADLGTTPLITAETIAGLQGELFLQALMPRDGQLVTVRLLAVPADGGRAVVVGASLADQHEDLARLAALLGLAGPLVLALVTGVGWLVAGAALRPIESMRRETAAISASEPHRRLAVPRSGDEVARLAETLNAMLERLHQALESERRFVSDASHELRTPLANMSAELELALRRPRTPAEMEAALRSTSEETSRLVRLAEDLLVLARADGGGIPLVRERVDIARLANETIDAFSARSRSRGVAMHARVPAGLQASFDPLRMRQALGNLLDNALRHTPSGGRVMIDAEGEDGLVVIQVSDTGEGFPAPFLPLAFEPFSRADAARSRADGGTGLGLALVRAVVEAHGGTVEATNRPDGGASVTVRLPA